MAIEIGGSSPRETDFTFEGKPLFVRRLPLRLGLKLQQVSDGDSVPADTIAEIIAECIVLKDGTRPWSFEDVLDFDTPEMLRIFSEISESSVGDKEAEKN